jgi:hypothetical protein
MRKSWFLFIVLICVGLFITSGIIIAADLPETIVIDGKSYKKDIKGPVNFNHAKHNNELKIGCQDCHHEYENGVNTWKEGDQVKKCAECHDPLKNEGNKKKLMLAYHKNCQNCHKEKAKEGSEAPTKKCEGCHQK